LDAISAANVFLVDPPMPLAEFNAIVSDETADGAGMEMMRPANIKRRQALAQWLRQTAEQGFLAHLRHAWIAWEPNSRAAKESMRTLYDELHFQVQRREGELRQAAAAEDHDHRVLREAQAKLVQLRRWLAESEQHSEGLRKAIAEKERLVAKVSARMGVKEAA
jgi:hypothetical protein